MKRNWMARPLVSLLLAAGLLSAGLSAQAAGIKFVDVSANAYYADAVDWAVDQGVTAGTSDITFSPSATVTRSQAMTFLWRAAGSPQPSSTVSPFTDVADPSAYYYKPVLWAVENDITAGVSATEFGPEVTLAYDQIFTFLCKAAGDTLPGSDWSSGAVAWARENGLTDELDFDAKSGCPRSDVIYCLWSQFDGEQVQEEKPQEELETPVGLSDEDGAKAAILNGFLSRTTYIDVSACNLEPSVVEKLVKEIADQEGENPYGISQVVCYTAENGLARQVAVTYQSNQNNEIFTEVTQQVQARAEEIVADVVTPGMSDYDIAKALHDYLILHCDYDMRYYTGNLPLVSYSAQGALLEGTAVCAGYAKAYEILMEAAGIPCEYVSGYAHGSHAWNIVQIDGAWYHVDTTWDDPTNRGGDYIRYDYFLLSDSAMGRDHSRWTASHACTSAKYDSLNLPDSEDQKEQQEQEEREQAIADAVEQYQKVAFDALNALPYQTQAELEAASDEELEEAYRVTIRLPDRGLDASTLKQVFRDVRDEISDQYPDLTPAGTDVSALSLSYYRDDIKAEQNRREEIEREEQKAEEEAQKEEEEAQKQEEENQADARLNEITERLEQAIRSCDAYGSQITLSGYTQQEIQQAVQKLRAYGFDGYTYSDFKLTVEQQQGVVTIQNLKAEQSFIAQAAEEIQAGIDQKIERIRFEPDPDVDFQKYSILYQRAADVVDEAGYRTPGGLVQGQDYDIYSVTGSSISNEPWVLDVVVKYFGQATEDDSSSQDNTQDDQQNNQQDDQQDTQQDDQQDNQQDDQQDNQQDDQQNNQQDNQQEDQQSNQQDTQQDDTQDNQQSNQEEEKEDTTQDNSTPAA